MLTLSSNVSDVFPKVLKLSFERCECKPLFHGCTIRAAHTFRVTRNADVERNEVGRCRLTL